VFTALSAESDRRLREVHHYLKFLKRHAPKLTSRVGSPWLFTSLLEHKAAKGLFFVHLYGAYEFTVRSALRATLNHLTASRVTYRGCQPVLLSVLLDAELRSFRDSGREGAWEARRKLFDLAHSRKRIEVDENVDPTTGRNVDVQQLRSIWASLCVKTDFVPRPQLLGRISELVSARVNLSHGHLPAAEIGSRFTVQDLETIHRDISEICTHVINSLEDYVKRGHYRR
jgi:MAE_28990/MAE_18760-like HEPN